MFYLRTPFGGNIFKGRWTNYGEADEEHIRLRIGQGSETIVVLLTRGIPQPQGYGHSVTDHRGRVVVENGGHIFAGEAIGGVGYQHTGLAHCTITHHHAFDWSSA